METPCLLSKSRYMIIVASGKGARMGSDIPKQFLPLGGKPIIMRTIERIKEADNNINIVLVLAKEHQDYWLLLCSEYSFSIEHKIVTGGEQRFNSVQNGLNSIEEDSIIGIHDGVRPLVDIDVVNNCFTHAQIFSNAVPVIKPVESLRLVKGGKNSYLDRDSIVLIQTPQCFESKLIKKAYSQPYNKSFTDDASVVESIGVEINLIEGNYENIKITNHSDLIIAETLFNDSRY